MPPPCPCLEGEGDCSDRLFKRLAKGAVEEAVWGQEMVGSVVQAWPGIPGTLPGWALRGTPMALRSSDAWGQKGAVPGSLTL